MKIVRSKDFTGSRAWEALDIANMNGITTRLHWTDQPYRWHINDGEEVFVVLDGRVQMHYRDNGFEQVAELGVGDIFYASVGTEHVAHPQGPARLLRHMQGRRQRLQGTRNTADGFRQAPHVRSLQHHQPQQREVNQLGRTRRELHQ